SFALRQGMSTNRLSRVLCSPSIQDFSLALASSVYATFAAARQLDDTSQLGTPLPLLTFPALRACAYAGMAAISKIPTTTCGPFMVSVFSAIASITACPGHHSETTSCLGGLHARLAGRWTR